MQLTFFKKEKLKVFFWIFEFSRWRLWQNVYNRSDVHKHRDFIAHVNMCKHKGGAMIKKWNSDKNADDLKII